MASLPFTLLEQGDPVGALDWVFTNYLGFGIIWMLIGIMLAAVVYGKTESGSITGIFLIAFSIPVGVAFPPEIQKYFLLLIGILIAVAAIKLWLSRGDG